MKFFFFPKNSLKCVTGQTFAGNFKLTSGVSIRETLHPLVSLLASLNHERFLPTAAHDVMLQISQGEAIRRFAVSVIQSFQVNFPKRNK